MGYLGGKKRTKEITKLHLEEVSGHLHQEREKEKGEVSGPESSPHRGGGAFRRCQALCGDLCTNPPAPDPGRAPSSGRLCRRALGGTRYEAGGKRGAER